MYISKSFKKFDTFTCRNVLKYLLAFDHESKRKLSLIPVDSLLKIIMYMTLGLKFLVFMPKYRVFLISKSPHSDVMELLVRLWSKVFVSQGQIQA